MCHVCSSMASKAEAMSLLKTSNHCMSDCYYVGEKLVFHADQCLSAVSFAGSSACIAWVLVGTPHVALLNFLPQLAMPCSEFSKSSSVVDRWLSYLQVQYLAEQCRLSYLVDLLAPFEPVKNEICRPAILIFQGFSFAKPAY